MTRDSPLRHLAPYFHQDMNEEYGTIENAVATAAIELRPEARKEVLDYVSALLEGAEILAKLNTECRNASFDVYFKDEVGARRFCNLLKEKMKSN